MSVQRGFGLNGAKYFTNVVTPQEIHLNFIVDSLNGNGLGLRSLKSNGYVEAVYMNVQTGAAGTPTLGTARSYAVLGASAVTSSDGSAGTILTGNLGIFPGTAITGFPPATVSGQINATNTAAANAQASAQATYTALQARTPTTIATELGGQTLAGGTYKAASGTFTLGGSSASALVLSGSATDVYVFQTTTTLITGGTNTPLITLGNVLPSNIYWVVGSSATLNSSNGGTFSGNVIAQTSITVTDAGTVNGSLIALVGAVTLTAATVVNVQALAGGFVAAGNPNPAPGYVVVKFKNNFNNYLGGYSGFVSPLTGTVLTSTVKGQPYVIVSLGTTTATQWTAAGMPAGFTPAVGSAFIALATGAIGGTGAVEQAATSGISSMEVVGDPNQEISNSALAQNGGAMIILQMLTSGVLTTPKDGSVAGMLFSFDRSSVQIPDAAGQTGI
jgi:hypothetical protein